MWGAVVIELITVAMICEIRNSNKNRLTKSMTFIETDANSQLKASKNSLCCVLHQTLFTVFDGIKQGFRNGATRLIGAVEEVSRWGGMSERQSKI